MYHLTFNLPFVLTWPLVIAALIGTVFAAKKREFWPILGFAALFFLSLGFSQVRFMRYLLPLAPPLCLLAAYGVSRFPFPKVCGAIVAAFALVGCSNVLWPFVAEDPRDRAAKAMSAPNSKIGLLGNPWFYTPPFQAQGFNQAVAGVVATGFDAKRIGEAKLDFFAVSEFEWRERARLDPKAAASFFVELERQLANSGGESGIDQQFRQYRFKNHPILELPGRDFVPHDFLYTNPKIRLYGFGRNRRP